MLLFNVHMSAVKLNILVRILFYTVHCCNVLNSFA